MKNRLLLGFFSCLILFGCATGGKGASSRLPRSREMTEHFEQAEKLFLAGRREEAGQAYQSYLNRFPSSFYTPKAHFRLGELLLVQEKWSEAIPFYEQSLAKGVDPQWGAEAVYQFAVCHHRLGEDGRSFEILDRFPEDSDAMLRVKAGSLRARGGKRQGDPLQEITGYLELIDGYALLPPWEWKVGDLTWVIDHKEGYEAIRGWVEKGEVDLDSLKGLSRRFAGKTSGGYVLWKMAKVSHARGNYGQAVRLADRYLHRYPKHEYVSSARQLLAELGKRESGFRARIGVILPLSGRFGVYGNSVLQGLECAAGIFTPCGKDLGVTLEIRDSEGDPKKAVALVQELAGSLDVVALIGPLTQGEAEAVAPVAEEIQIPLIALSQKEGLPESGAYVFRNFLTVADQAATLVHYACGERRLSEFAILYPQGPGGEEYLKKFEEEVTGCGGKVVAKEGYPPGQTSFLGPLRSLRNSKETYQLEKRLPFEALFFPDTYRNVPDLVASLKFLRLNGVQLLGGPGWDHPDLLKGNPKEAEGAIFVNGFFPKSAEFLTRDFSASFQATYGLEPTLLEAYAYDTLRLLGEILKDHPTAARADLQQELSLVKNFQGVTGNISFDSAGDARRRLFLLTVKNGEIREVR